MSYTLITGASMGLGLELARLFASDGHDLVLTARSGDRLEALAATLRTDFEVDVRCVSMDLTRDQAVPQLLQALKDEGIGIRVLVNNAGFGVYGHYSERDWPTYRSLIDLNITALAHLTHALLPQIRGEGGATPTADRCDDPAQANTKHLHEGSSAIEATASNGRLRGILNVASTAAFQPGPLMAAYFASKAFVLSFTEALHEELRGTGVKVTAFCPGPTKTDFFTTDVMIPRGKITEADLAEYHRRQAKRMDAALAARIGYQGFLAGKAVVIPGRLNSFQAWLAPRMPRGLVRRITHRMLQK